MLHLCVTGENQNSLCAAILAGDGCAKNSPDHPGQQPLDANRTRAFHYPIRCRPVQMQLRILQQKPNRLLSRIRYTGNFDPIVPARSNMMERLQLQCCAIEHTTGWMGDKS